MEVRWFLEVRGFLLQFTGESEASTVGDSQHESFPVGNIFHTKYYYTPSR